MAKKNDEQSPKPKLEAELPFDEAAPSPEIAATVASARDADDSAYDNVEVRPDIDKVQKSYGANDLSKLEGLEAVRHRPAMYIGDTGMNGMHHLFKEIIDNSIDEVLAGFCTKISVTLHKDRTITVTDNGRGIPVDINTQTGMSGVQMVMTELHAGGKFGDGGYKTSGGLHGVGASCVNAPFRLPGNHGSARWQGLLHALRARRTGRAL